MSSAPGSQRLRDYGPPGSGGVQRSSTAAPEIPRHGGLSEQGLAGPSSLTALRPRSAPGDEGDDDARFFRGRRSPSQPPMQTPGLMQPYPEVSPMAGPGYSVTVWQHARLWNPSSSITQAPEDGPAVSAAPPAAARSMFRPSPIARSQIPLSDAGALTFTLSPPEDEVQRLEDTVRSMSEECARHTRELAETRRAREEAQRAILNLRNTLESKDQLIQILQEQVNGRRSIMFSLQRQNSDARPVQGSQGDTHERVSQTTDPSFTLPGAPDLNSPPAPSEVDIGAALDHIYDQARRWALVYAPYLSTSRDEHLPLPLQEVLKDLTQPFGFKHFLGDPQYRWGLVSKLIIQYLVEEVLTCDVLVGFRSDWDQILTQCQAERQRDPHKFVPCGRYYPGGCAVLVSDFMSQAGAGNFLEGKLVRAVTELSTLLRPLLAPDIDRGAAQSSLERIVRAGFRMHLALYSSQVEWHFDFPTVGSRWSLIPRARRDESRPLDPGAPDMRVQLAITPAIVKRDQTAHTLLVTTVRQADVFLRPWVQA